MVDPDTVAALRSTVATDNAASFVGVDRTAMSSEVTRPPVKKCSHEVKAW